MSPVVSNAVNFVLPSAARFQRAWVEEYDFLQARRDPLLLLERHGRLAALADEHNLRRQ